MLANVVLSKPWSAQFVMDLFPGSSREGQIVLLMYYMILKLNYKLFFFGTTGHSSKG